MKAASKWFALIRLRRRLRAAERLVAARHTKAEAHKRACLHGPPLTPEQVEAGYAAVEAERNG